MEEDYACKPLNQFNIKEQFTLDRSPIIMIDRGSCSFVTKARNVQNINGLMALIINNNDEPIDHMYLKDDGTGSDIFIPTLMISKADGEIIKNYLKQNRNNKRAILDIIVSIEFKIVK